MTFLRSLLFVILAAVLAIGQASKLEHSSSGTGVKQLLEAITSLPPEYKADLAFTLLEADSTLSVSQRKALLDDVFRSSTRAHYQYLLVNAAGRPDGLSSQVELTLRFSHSDALNIQARAVEHARSVSPQFARQMFEDIRLLPARSYCKDASVPDVTAYYEAAQQLLSDKRIKSLDGKEKPLYLIELASNMRTPPQIAPLAVLITRLSISDNDLRQVGSTFIASLSKITASDREITAAENSSHITDAIEALATKLDRSDGPASLLLQTYRNFLIRSLSGESCADRSLSRTDIVRRFNSVAQKNSAMSIPLLSDIQLTAKVSGDAAINSTIDINQALLPQIQRIAVAKRARMAEEYRQNTPGTIEPQSADVDAVLQYAFSPERNDAPCAVCDFYSKAAIFVVLMDMLPPGQQMQRCIDGEVNFLASHAIEQDDPPAWLLILKRLLNMSRTPTHETADKLAAQAKAGVILAGAPSSDGLAIRRALGRSSDPVIAAYLLADHTLRLPYDFFGAGK